MKTTIALVETAAHSRHPVALLPRSDFEPKGIILRNIDHELFLA